MVFPVSDVVYLSIKEGRRPLLQMHSALNTGPLKYQEPFPYHPHITLAQNLTHDQSLELAAVARKRWSEYPYPRVFPVESLSFVQNTVQEFMGRPGPFPTRPGAIHSPLSVIRFAGQSAKNTPSSTNRTRSGAAFP